MLTGYVKNTSNCAGLPLGWDTNIQVIEDLGEHSAATVKTGEPLRKRRIVGWTDLFMGRPCSIHAYRVEQITDEAKGILITGGNSGVRILANKNDRDFRTKGVDDHLPNGWGMPILWIDDESDLIQFED